MLPLIVLVLLLVAEYLLPRTPENCRSHTAIVLALPCAVLLLATPVASLLAVVVLGCATALSWTR